MTRYQQCTRCGGTGHTPEYCRFPTARASIAPRVAALAIAAFVAAALAASCARADDMRCHERAAMYVMALAVKDLPDERALNALRAYTKTSDTERLDALYQVRGQLNHLSSQRLYKHVLIACRGGQ